MPSSRLNASAPAAAIAHSPKAWLRVGALAATFALAGCAVGPDFKPPAARASDSYAAHSPHATAGTPNVTAGAAQHFERGAELPADWWTLFRSAPLDALIRQALANNHDLKAAQAALTVAHETTLSGRGAYAPSVSAGISASREQDPPGALAPVPSSNAYLYNLFTPQVSVSYVPDVFGLNRRTVESLAAQEDAARYQLLATQITLSANVVAAAVQEASLQAQLDATQQLVAINRHMLEILQRQFAKGYASRLDVAAQTTQLAQVNATLPPLVMQLQQQQHLLAVLVGRTPGEAPPATFTLDGFTLPEALPLSLPSALVAQRPDVLQAQANLHVASAQIGVAEASRLPQIELTANAGRTALAIGEVFKPGSGFWNLGAAISAPIFQGGALMHQERAAKAAYVQAAEQYRGTVLTAFQNVADVLSALQQDAEGLKAAATAADAAKITLDLSQRQWKDGYAGYLAVLSAEQSYQQARIALVQAQASRLADSAALFQALGGGWWQATHASQTTSVRNHDEK
ncbi:efflux transporter outer membrane subunit [Dyella ginsengisoli]|uniref:Efflux transporter outer membrane subunit n=1 Tax=Dyella ginsengisoli TaxID=363848 RepID=A0ABW8JQ74_9GAMM